MLGKRYRTIHDMRLPNANTMSNLGGVSETRPSRCRAAYISVKFMVKVRLVEKSLNSNVGRVMEVNVTTQYRIAGIKRPTRIANAPRRPSHVRDILPSPAVANAEGRSDAGVAAVLRNEVEAVVPGGTFPWRDASMVGPSVGDHAACWAEVCWARM